MMPGMFCAEMGLTYTRHRTGSVGSGSDTLPAVFERLFLSALEHDQLAPALEEWRYVADANGGFSLADIEPATARELKAGLRAAASAELARLGDVDLQTEDGTYKVSLEKLLAITDGD